MTNTIMVKKGIGEIKALYLSLLNSKRVDFVCLSTDYQQVLGNWYDQEFAPKLFESEVITREIVAENAENRSYGKNKDGIKNSVRFMSYQGGQADLILTDTFATLVSFNQENPYIVMIEDQELVKSFRAQFSLLWDGAARNLLELSPQGLALRAVMAPDKTRPSPTEQSEQTQHNL